MGDRKTERIRDPIHGLIVFRAADEVDQLAWRLVNAREFQRLRNIRQLGFSDFVFPGATHTRFAHCIGVFHTARQLVEAIRREVGSEFNEERAAVAVLAALLHDVGHGPFSHAFERVGNASGQRRRHEDRTADIVTGDTEIRDALGDLSDEIAELLKQQDPADIYASVVSSQFDADRLDYLRRDRYMTGTGSAAIDVDWLLDNLRVGPITVQRPGDDRSSDDEELVEADGFHLGHKALSAAEEYLLARFHLYRQVYLHKTTRAAECMLTTLLARTAELSRSERSGMTGLPDGHPLLAYFADETLDAYLALDDASVWSGLASMASAQDGEVRNLASSLRRRRLYKCFDVGERARQAGGDSLSRYRKRLQDRRKSAGHDFRKSHLEDSARIGIYGRRRFDEPGALQKVLVERKGVGRPEDISEISDVLRGVEERHLYRVYAPDDNAKAELEKLWEDAT